MKIVYRLLVCAVLLGCTFFINEVSAVPVKPGVRTITQPDGSKLKVIAYGDEFAHYATTEDGYGIYVAEDGFAYYLNTQNSSSSNVYGVRAKDASSRTVADRVAMKGAPMGVPWGELQAKRQEAAAKTEMIESDPQMQALRQIRMEKMNSGEKFRSIVILVEFQDVRFSINEPKTEITNMLNQPGYTKTGVSSVGSAWDYYNENSTGTFDPQFDVYGPYLLSQNLAYYGAGQRSDARPGEMIKEACQLGDNDINYAEYADNGTVRDIFVFYAGYAESDTYPNQSDNVWPHRWYLSSAIGSTLNLDGVTINGYACSSELRWGRSAAYQPAGIGTFCHEYGHVLGFPDYYATNDSNSLVPSTYFLMDSGSHNDDGRTPPSLSTINRLLAGWIEPDVLETPGDYELPHISENKAYIIRISGSGDTGEYFTLETRSTDANKWDAGMKSGSVGRNGLFIMKIDRRSSYLSRWKGNTLNNAPTHPCAMPVTALKANWSNYSGWTNQNRWIFPQTGATSISSATHSDFKPWSGTNDLTISNISYSGGKVTFTVSKPVTGITLDETDVTIFAGNTLSLNARVLPEGSSGYEIEWTSTNNTVATVDNNGMVRGVSVGSAVITAQISGTSLYATCNVTVESKMGDINTVYVYQNDAEFSWAPSSDEEVTGYKAEVLNSSDVVVFTENIQDNSVYVPYLIPGSSYTFRLTAISGTEELYDSSVSFNTDTVKGDYAYMDIKGSYGSSAVVPLHLKDVAGEISSIVWKVDGNEVSAPSVQLAAGRHEITATVTTKSNGVETITKFVNVQ